MNMIVETVTQYLPVRRRVTPTGWISFNCIACIHNGTSADTRGRAGVHIDGDNISYSCFNCKFKASWQPGHNISKKFKNLMTWLNIPDELIIKCSREAFVLTDQGETRKVRSLLPEFLPKKLPDGAKPIRELVDAGEPEGLQPILEYISSRGLYLDDYNFHWTTKDKNRLIIPFTYKNRVVGHTTRSILENVKNRYISEQQLGYVFNMDAQTYDREFVVVCEGAMDAISIDAISILGSTIAGGQHQLINTLHREVIVVPDHDEDGLKLATQAGEIGWSVSFPDWDSDINDINQAVNKYGRLYTLYSIIKAKQSNPLKIKSQAASLAVGWRNK